VIFLATVCVCKTLSNVDLIMKKFVLLSALIAVFALTACGQKEEAAMPVEAPVVEAPVVVEAPAAAATETAVVPAAVEVVKEAVTEAAKQ
jgi:predicted small lipoprotein YifL